MPSPNKEDQNYEGIEFPLKTSKEDGHLLLVRHPHKAIHGVTASAGFLSADLDITSPSSFVAHAVHFLQSAHLRYYAGLLAVIWSNHLTPWVATQKICLKSPVVEEGIDTEHQMCRRNAKGLELYPKDNCHSIVAVPPMDLVDYIMVAVNPYAVPPIDDHFAFRIPLDLGLLLMPQRHGFGFLGQEHLGGNKTSVYTIDDFGARELFCQYFGCRLH
eukprot:Gb_17821 [translate_table: standard]